MQVLLNITQEEIDALSLFTTGRLSQDNESLNSLHQKLTEAVESAQDETVNTTFKTSTIKDITLGHQLIFDPHTKLHLVDKGAYIRFPHAESIFHHFGIGKDHVGYLVMTREAWAALNAPELVEIIH